MDLFSQVLDKIYDGLEITFTPKNVAPFDDFLIFSACKKIKVKFHTAYVPFWVEFEGDEPMLLENCPDSFFRSILKNVA